MNKEKVENGINKLLDIIKPKEVSDIEFKLEPTGDKNEYYMSVVYIVPDDSRFLRTTNRSESDMFRNELNQELKRNIAAYVNTNVIINSSGVRSESYNNDRVGHNNRQNEAILKIEKLLKG